MVRAPDPDFDELASRMLERIPRIIGEAGMALEPRLSELHDEAVKWRDELSPEIVSTRWPDPGAQFHRLAQAVVAMVSAASQVPPSRRGPDSYFASKVDDVDEALDAAAAALPQ